MMTDVPFHNLEAIISKWKITIKFIFVLWIFVGFLLTTSFKAALSTNLVKEDVSEEGISDLVHHQGYRFEVSVLELSLFLVTSCLENKQEKRLAQPNFS